MRLDITTAQAGRQIVEFDQVAEDALVSRRRELQPAQSSFYFGMKIQVAAHAFGA